MSGNKSKKSAFKRLKDFLILGLIVTLVAETIVLVRLYKLHIASPSVVEVEEGEALDMPADLREQVSRLRRAFRDTSASAWALAQKSENPEDAWFNMGYRPRADLRADENAYYLTIDVPGVDAAELSANLDGLTLTVTGVRKRSRESGTLLQRERFRGEFSRAFELPGKVSSEEVSAVLADGILKIKIPRGDSDDSSVAIPIER